MIDSFRQLKGLPREVWVLFGATVVNRMGAMAFPFLAIYLTRERGIQANEVAWLLGIFGVASILVSPAAGKLSDRIGGIGIMVSSLLLSGIVLLLFPVFQTFRGIAILTVIWAIANESYRPASITVLSKMIDASRRKQAFALMRFGINVGVGIGSAVGGFLAQVSFNSLFIIDGITCVVSSVILGIFLWTPERKAKRAAVKLTPEETAARAAPGASAFRDLEFCALLVAVLAVGIVFAQHNSSMPVYLSSILGLNTGTIGLLFTVNMMLIVLFEIPLTTRLASWSPARALGLGAGLIAAGFGALALATHAWQVALTIMVWTLGEMLLFPAMMTYVTECSPPSRRGEYMGAYVMSFGAAFAIGPWLGTKLMAAYGPRVLWLVMCGLGLASAMGFVAVSSGRRTTT